MVAEVAGAAVYRYRLEQRHQKKRFNDQWEISWQVKGRDGICLVLTIIVLQSVFVVQVL